MKSFNKTKLSLALGLATAALLGAQVYAQGTAGTTSNDSLSVSVEKQAQVIVNGLGDVNFGSVTSTPSAATEAFCIGQNYSGNVGVTFDGTVAATPTGNFNFELSGPTEDIRYAAYFDATGVDATTTDTVMADNVQQSFALTTTRTLTQADASCTGGDNVSLAIDLNSTDFDAASFGDTYTDTLTITVAAL